ncbi:golgin, RAB6 interacting [Phyllostomus discolor]|uniref:RAB6-interacting golgin n=1 Tax=Phyllostomus discolor TaxID=89673 RepID=A0A834D846_9CHIR|nr:golgin, RAB6 interacting [Phyllostomus discolor]
MVSADIGILRNRIDQASLDYSNARKRFDRVEAEYVTAKLDLQRKTDIKEQLTEHLCTIIQQNELRKAKKLEELMQQLDVQADEESLELDAEVERLLHEQEAEAGKQKVRGESDWKRRLGCSEHVKQRCLFLPADGRSARSALCCGSAAASGEEGLCQTALIFESVISFMLTRLAIPKTQVMIILYIGA